MSRFLLVVASLLGKNRAMYASQVKQMFGGRFAPRIINYFTILAVFLLTYR